MNKCFLCGNDAFYQFKNGNWCCSDNINKCPEKRRKDSQNKKGKKPNWKNGHPRGMLGKKPWNTGKIMKELLGTKKAMEYGKKISRALLNSEKHHHLGQSLSADGEKTRRKKISDSINKRYANGWMPKAGRCKKIHYESSYAGNVLLDGSWELECAKYFDKNKVLWTRNKNRFCYNFEKKDRFYTPDFYLVEYGVYIEVKGYITDKDRAKWEYFPHKLYVLQKREIQAIIKNKFDLKSIMEG